MYTVLDITAKIIFGLYSLSDVEERSAEEIARGEVPEHELRPAPDIFHERWDRGPTQSERPATA